MAKKSKRPVAKAKSSAVAKSAKKAAPKASAKATGKAPAKVASKAAPKSAVKAGGKHKWVYSFGGGKAEGRAGMKNLLGVVRALATQTAVEGRTAEEYRDVFIGRLEAILEAEDLSQSRARESDLTQFLERALAAVQPDRIAIEKGPPVKLPATIIVPLSMIFHELVTNAIKYGALCAASGKVRVGWRLLDGADTLRFDWSEESGPKVSEPRSSGFGSRLIRFTAARTLKGSAELRYEPEGLKVCLILPLSDGGHDSISTDRRAE